MDTFRVSTLSNIKRDKTFHCLLFSLGQDPKWGHRVIMGTVHIQLIPFSLYDALWHHYGCSPSSSHCLISTFLSYSGSKSTNNPSTEYSVLAMERWLLRATSKRCGQGWNGKDPLSNPAMHRRLLCTPSSEENINPSESSRAIPGRSPWKLCFADAEGDSPSRGGTRRLQEQPADSGLRTLCLHPKQGQEQ